MKFPAKFKYSNFEKYDGKNCSYAHLKVYGVAMAQYGHNDKLLIQTFPRSLTGPVVTWFTKLNISKMKKLIDLEFNSKIAPDPKQL